ncbi:MAG: type II toxin-antitoxin system HicA family toxin [Candidatus Omnitrophica bacterium]|nr:type II toxin-antitoxin system HicA family toxin [Candidatus Omnitrophota bacterium]
MSRLIPLKASEVLRILSRLGFERIRQKGSHIFLRHPDGRSTVVPMHKGEDIGRGLIRKILSDIEIIWEDFEKYR